MKYHRMLRLPLGERRKETKRYASTADVDDLLSGYVYVTEKFDGSIVSFSKRHGKIIGRGRRKVVIKDGVLTEHTKPYRFLDEWYWNNEEWLQVIPEGVTVFGEYLRIEHTVHYNTLPDYYLVFDMYDGKKFLSLLDEKCVEILDAIDLWHVPVLDATFDDRHLTRKDLNRLAVLEKSVYGNRMEGFVVKDYDRQLFMKFVKYEFDEDLEQNPHWMKQPIKFNELLRSKEGEKHEHE